MDIDPGKENFVPTSFVAKFLNLPGERVRQISDQGLLEYKQVGNGRRFDLIPTVNTYLEYLKKQGRNTSNLPDDARKMKADADWKEAKAEIEQMKRDELKGSLHSSEDVEKITADMVMAIRAQILALPGMCAVDCAEAATPAEAAGIIKNAVNDILNGLTEYEYDPAKYKELVKEREDWIKSLEEGSSEEEN
ncbi:MAG: hypothetical protein IJL91_06905 [Bacteroidales bacterium]|nr:hypothetical protein [Bacteroidales bacterium]